MFIAKARSSLKTRDSTCRVLLMHRYSSSQVLEPVSRCAWQKNESEFEVCFRAKRHQRVARTFSNDWLFSTNVDKASSYRSKLSPRSTRRHVSRGRGCIQEPSMTCCWLLRPVVGRAGVSSFIHPARNDLVVVLIPILAL